MKEATSLPESNINKIIEKVRAGQEYSFIGKISNAVFTLSHNGKNFILSRSEGTFGKGKGKTLTLSIGATERVLSINS